MIVAIDKSGRLETYDLLTAVPQDVRETVMLLVEVQSFRVVNSVEAVKSRLLDLKD